MRKTSLHSLVLLAAAALIHASIFADTVVLSSGEKVAGRILSETDAEVRVEITDGGIVDERVIPRSEIASIQRQSADAIAWGRLAGLKLGANSLPGAASYETYLAPLKAFATQFPDSEHREAAEKVAAEFEAEKKRVADGEIKLNGAWLSKDEAQRERYQINGTIAFNYLKDQAARGDLIQALNTFDVLERQFIGSSGYVDAVEYVRRMLPAVKQQADARLALLPGENAERERGVQAAAGLAKRQLQEELDNETRNLENAVAEAKRAGLKWPPFLPRSLDSMKTISTLATSEVARLASVDVAKARRSIELARLAREALAQREVEAAEESLREARELWAQNELVARLEKEIGDFRTAAVASTSTETNSPEAAPAPEAAAAPEKFTESTPTGATPPSDATPAPDADPAPAPDPGPPVAEESAPNLPMIIVLIVVIGGFAFAGLRAYQNVRRKANEIIE